MAILGVQDLGSLPCHCLDLCISFFAAAIAINMARDLARARAAAYIPLSMAMVIPFYLGPYFGSLVRLVWDRLDPARAKAFAPPVASGGPHLRRRHLDAAAVCVGPRRRQAGRPSA